MMLTLRLLLNRQLSMGASLHTFLHCIQNGKLLTLAWVTDEKQLFQAEWYEKGGTGNEGIALARACSQGASPFGWRNALTGSSVWGRGMAGTPPRHLPNDKLQVIVPLRKKLFRTSEWWTTSWLGGSSEAELHSESTRLQVTPCAAALCPQRPRPSLAHQSYPVLLLAFPYNIKSKYHHSLSMTCGQDYSKKSSSGILDVH